MANKIRGDALLRLRTLLNGGAIGALSDGQLLERFTTGRGEPRESAFAALVERHGPFVLRVCRSVLHDADAAEDAFQATFLALARKAGSLWARDSLAPWLHQAAYRAAIHDRSATLRRRLHEHAAAALRSESQAPADHADVDLAKIVHEEIDRLPNCFRVAVVLCDLEGRTHEQAANHLGCAVGTVKSRLARGRKRLRERLVRRGVASAHALAALSAGVDAQAAVPAGLAMSTVAYATTESAVPMSVALITEGVVIAMVPGKVKFIVAAIAVLAAIAAGAVALNRSEVNRPGDATQKTQQVDAASAPSAGSHRIVLTSPKSMDVTITQPYVCQIHAQRYINIRSLDRGFLDEINIKAGQAVKAGDLLFKIAPVPLKPEPAALDAPVLKPKFNVAPIHAVGEPPAKPVGVKAPFDGYIARVLKQKGTLLEETDVVAELADDSTMWVYFNVPETQYLEYMASVKENAPEPKIELILADGTKFGEPGKIGAIETTIRSAIGSVAFRADFPNPNRRLHHGQTGTVLVHRTIPNALVIPQRATFEILDKRYVFVIDNDDVVHQRPIVVQHEVDDIFVIKSGLEVGDRIVLDGIRQLHDSEKVKYQFRTPEEVLEQPKDREE